MTEAQAQRDSAILRPTLSAHASSRRTPRFEYMIQSSSQNTTTSQEKASASAAILELDGQAEPVTENVIEQLILGPVYPQGSSEKRTHISLRLTTLGGSYTIWRVYTTGLRKKHPLSISAGACLTCPSSQISLTTSWRKSIRACKRVQTGNNRLHSASP
jgi:hypothetical protein